MLVNKYHITSKIMKEAFDSFIKRKKSVVNITFMSRVTGTAKTSLWFYISGMRKWNVESWFRCLACLGMVEVLEDGIKIKTRHTEDIKAMIINYQQQGDLELERNLIRYEAEDITDNEPRD